MAPSGPVAAPFVFEWTGGGPDATYRVSVFDPAERLLFSWDTRSSRVDPPRDLGPYFRMGGSFLWKVAEVEQSNRPARETPLVSFTVQEIPGPSSSQRS